MSTSPSWPTTGSTELSAANIHASVRARPCTSAGINIVEPVVGQLGEVDIFAKGERWAEERRPGLIAAIEQRLDQLQTWLGDRDHLEGRFTAGDLLMADVLRNLDHTDLIDRRPGLKAYRDRCTARPAFRKAMADQLASFENLETVG
jgi:glutathione S-transferase